MSLYTALNILNILLVVLAGVLLSTRVFSKNRTLEAFSGEDYVRRLGELTTTVITGLKFRQNHRLKTSHA